MQVVGDIAQAPQGQDGSGVRGAQPLDGADRVRRDGAGGVVEDQAGEERAVGAGRRARGELGEDEPGEYPGRLRVRPFREVDPDPYGVFERAQREGPGRARGVEEPGEGGPVEGGDPVGECRSWITRSPGLPGAGVEFALQAEVAARVERLAQGGERGRTPSRSSRRSGTEGKRPWAAR